MIEYGDATHGPKYQDLSNRQKRVHYRATVRICRFPANSSPKEEDEGSLGMRHSDQTHEGGSLPKSGYKTQKDEKWLERQATNTKGSCRDPLTAKRA